MKYRVKLHREVRDLLCAYVEVEADSADAARDAALTEAAEKELDWELDICDPDPGEPEVVATVEAAEKELDWELDICDPDPGEPEVVATVEVHEPATQEG